MSKISEEMLESANIMTLRYDNETPEVEPIPCGYSELDSFQFLLIIPCFRPDRLINATKNFIMWKLYDYFVQPPSLVYDKIYALSSERSPIVFVVFPGADPLADVQKFGDEMGFTGNEFKFVSLGQGMGPTAASFISEGSSSAYG
jgi:dynein heavy chain, axonemal